MEAVTTILGGGLRIGVLVHGKKVRDDSKMLLQNGISLDTLSDTLGFCLEPNPPQSTIPHSPEDSSFLNPCNVPHTITRSVSLERLICPSFFGVEKRTLFPMFSGTCLSLGVSHHPGSIQSRVIL